MKVLVSSLSPPLLPFHSAPKLWRLMKDLPMSLWPHWYSALQFGMIIMQGETALKSKTLVFTPNICAHLIICKQTQASHAFLPSVVSCYSSPVCQSGPHSLPGMLQKHSTSYSKANKQYFQRSVSELDHHALYFLLFKGLLVGICNALNKV